MLQILVVIDKVKNHCSQNNSQDTNDKIPPDAFKFDFVSSNIFVCKEQRQIPRHSKVLNCKYPVSQTEKEVLGEKSHRVNKKHSSARLEGQSSFRNLGLFNIYGRCPDKTREICNNEVDVNPL